MRYEDIRVELLENVPENSCIAYQLLEENLLGLRLIWLKDGYARSPKRESKPSHTYTVFIKEEHGKYTVNGDIVLIGTMMAFLPALIQDFARAAGVQGMITVKCPENVSLYMNVAVNWSFVVPDDLLRCLYPDFDPLIDCVHGPHYLDINMPVAGQDRYDVHLSLRQEKRRIYICTECYATNPENRQILLDFANTIRKVSEPALSILIGKVKKRMDANISDYVVEAVPTADNRWKLII